MARINRLTNGGTHLGNWNSRLRILHDRNMKNWKRHRFEKTNLRRKIINGDLKMTDCYCVLISRPVRSKLESQARYLHTEVSDDSLGKLRNIDDELMYPSRYPQSKYTKSPIYNKGKGDLCDCIKSFENKRMSSRYYYSGIKYPQLIKEIRSHDEVED